MSARLPVKVAGLPGTIHRIRGYFSLKARTSLRYCVGLLKSQPVLGATMFPVESPRLRTVAVSGAVTTWPSVLGLGDLPCHSQKSKRQDDFLRALGHD